MFRRRTRVHLDGQQDAAALAAISPKVLTDFLDADDRRHDAQTVDFAAPQLDLAEHRARNGPFMPIEHACPPPPMPEGGTS